MQVYRFMIGYAVTANRSASKPIAGFQTTADTK